MHQTLIHIHDAHVSLRYAGQNKRILHNIHWQLHEGEHCAILGANGAGKSTLLGLIRGELWAENIENAVKAPITWYMHGKGETSPIMGRRMTALVSASKQERYVRNEWRLCGEDILLTAFSDSELLFFIPERTQKEAVRAMAARLKCTHLLQQEAYTLSQGQLRLLMLGRALLREPQVLLLDEYMEGLDVSTRALILKALAACKTTMVFTGHRECSVPEWVQHIYFLQDGQLSKLDTAQKSATQAVSSTARSVTSSHGATTQESAHIILKDSTVFIDRKPLLQDLCWTWHKGQHWFLHGVNGAGKSTFLRLLAGDEYVAYGGTLERYSLKHTQPQLLQDRASISAVIRLISDKEQMTYAYDVTGLELVLSGIDLVQGQYRTYTEEEYAAARALLEEFSLTSLENRSVRTLSTGQLRRLLLARALMGSPEILLLDEPFSGLDSASYTALRHMLEALSSRVSMMLVSHYEEDRLFCINADAIMEEGRLRLL